MPHVSLLHRGGPDRDEPGGTRKVVRRGEVMGTVVSVHVVLRSSTDAPRHDDVRGVVMSATDAFLTSLRDDEAVFTPFAETSEIRRIARGDLSLTDASPRVRDVEAACLAAREVTQGRFDAWWKGWFDPTGYVKGWAVERSYSAQLAPLLDAPGVVAVGVNCGGDLRVGTAYHADGPAAEWIWRTGVVDPHDSSRLVATLELTDGAVATSGTSERGAHIVDPRATSHAEHRTGVASATVVSGRLDHADLWATTAVVAGFEDLTWIADAGTRSGLLVSEDGRTRRWAGGLEVTDVDGSGLGGAALT